VQTFWKSRKAFGKNKGGTERIKWQKKKINAGIKKERTGEMKNRSKLRKRNK
jgi:hypothetical protein